MLLIFIISKCNITYFMVKQLRTNQSFSRSAMVAELELTEVQILTAINISDAN